MNQIEILKEVDKKEKLLKGELAESNEEVDYFTTFLEENDISRIQDIEYMALPGLTIAYIRSTNPNLDLEWIRKKVSNFTTIIKISEAEDFLDFMTLLEATESENKITPIIESLRKSNTKVFSNMAMKKIFKDDPDRNTAFHLSLKKMGANDDEFLNFLELYNAVADSASTFSFLGAVKYIQEDLKRAKAFIRQQKEEGKELKEKNKSKFLNAMVKDQYHTEMIEREFSKIRRYARNIESLSRNNLRKKNKELLNYQEFSILFKKSLEKSEIGNEKDLISKINDDKLRLEVLKFIYEYNLNAYEETEKVYQTVSSDIKTTYQLLLKEYHITDENCSYERVMQRSIDDIKMILINLRKWKLDETSIILKVLNSEDHSSFTFLSNYIANGLFSEEFLRNNLNLFYSESKEYLYLNKNINCIQGYGLNPIIFRNHSEILLMNPDLLKENLKILSEYKLLKAMRTTEDYSFLTSKHLNKRIDEILELGYEKNLESSIYLLNADETQWKRIHLLKQLSFPIEETEDLQEQLFTDSFLLPDNQLDDYIYNKVSTILPYSLEEVEDISEEPQDLKGYISTSRTYKINNVIISRNKVKRNLTVLKKHNIDEENRLFYSVVYGSILTEDEYQTLSKEIQGTQKKI